MANGKRAPGQPGSAFKLGEVPALSTPSFGGPFSDIAQAVGGVLTGRREAREQAAKAALAQGQLAVQQQQARAQETRARAEETREQARLEKELRERDDLHATAEAFRKKFVEGKLGDVVKGLEGRNADEQVIRLGLQYFAPPVLSFQQVGAGREIVGFPTRQVAGAAGGPVPTGFTGVPSSVERAAAGLPAGLTQSLNIMKGVEDRAMAGDREAQRALDEAATGLKLIKFGKAATALQFILQPAASDEARQYMAAAQRYVVEAAPLFGARPSQFFTELEAMAVWPTPGEYAARLSLQTKQQSRDRLVDAALSRAGSAPLVGMQAVQQQQAQNFNPKFWKGKE